ncbi:MAG: hypothetical protein QXZ70_04000 [Candidatus Bathyarchaeia archaeon]
MLYEPESETITIIVEEPSFLPYNGRYIGGSLGRGLSAAGAIPKIKKYGGTLTR